MDANIAEIILVLIQFLIYAVKVQSSSRIKGHLHEPLDGFFRGSGSSRQMSSLRASLHNCSKRVVIPSFPRQNGL